MSSAVATRPRTPRAVAAPAVLPQPLAEDTRHCPPCLTSEAVAVMLAAAEHHALAEVWGMHSLVTLAHQSTEAAWEIVGSPRTVDQLSAASNELDGALGVIDIVNHNGMDCMLMHAARSLMMAAKLMMDAKCEELA